MRKLTAGVGALSVMLALAGCSSSSDDSESVTAPVTSSVAASVTSTTSAPETTTPETTTPVTSAPETSAPPTTPPSNAGSYTVAPGDTLSGIAARHGIPLGALLQANGLTVDSVIQPGQVLDVSGRPGPDPVNPAPTPGTTTYTVQPGDGLSDVALRFGGDLGEILRLNGFTAVDTVIYPGQVLIVPDKPGVGPYFPGAGNGGAPQPEDATCGQFSIGATSFNLVAVSTPAGRVGCGEAFNVMEGFIATPGAPGTPASVRGWDCRPRENNFPECTKDGLLMYGTPA
ncbi:LysM peptidoglycan-binding domain-containing protein [Rhodococcus kronopolitis]|uniref:LysM peptidoglycan-binding domain-containing protein n=1 Tax=Rhodococcus kronopolitis TaxID=1460226 RepID=A0ABV9FX29_9NOCA